mmetsp:Transcript_3157/g.9777  ORF Transcript_3157/g.9777 Transcript_3157/m.9777 type:complete len:235 (+) Transcript_3157:867-1571(+)
MLCDGDVHNLVLRTHVRDDQLRARRVGPLPRRGDAHQVGRAQRARPAGVPRAVLVAEHEVSLRAVHEPGENAVRHVHVPRVRHQVALEQPHDGREVAKQVVEGVPRYRVDEADEAVQVRQVMRAQIALARGRGVEHRLERAADNLPGHVALVPFGRHHMLLGDLAQLLPEIVALLDDDGRQHDAAGVRVDARAGGHRLGQRLQVDLIEALYQRLEHEPLRSGRCAHKDLRRGLR